MRGSTLRGTATELSSAGARQGVRHVATAPATAPATRRGWRLSPAYDLNPVPIDIKPRVLTTAIDEDDPTASLPLALDVAGYFEIDDAYEHDDLAMALGLGRT